MPAGQSVPFPFSNHQSANLYKMEEGLVLLETLKSRENEESFTP